MNCFIRIPQQSPWFLHFWIIFLVFILWPHYKNWFSCLSSGENLIYRLCQEKLLSVILYSLPQFSQHEVYIPHFTCKYSTFLCIWYHDIISHSNYMFWIILTISYCNANHWQKQKLETTKIFFVWMTHYHTSQTFNIYTLHAYNDDDS